MCASLLVLFAVSCADGVDDNERFSVSTTNTQLKSPPEIRISPSGTDNLQASWDYVSGAGGYAVHVAVVDDPENPEVLVDEPNYDRCSVIFENREDTKYTISVKTMGNEELNNKEAETETTKDYTTLVDAVKIPAGANLVEEITKALAVPSEAEERGFELEGGATYELDGLLDFGLNKVTFRGDKINWPTIKVGEKGGLVTQAGLKIKFLNFDCTEMKTSGLVMYSETPDASLSAETLYGATKKDVFVVKDLTLLQDINVKNLSMPLVSASKMNWAATNLVIRNCIIQLNKESGNESLLYFEDGPADTWGGCVKEMTVTNSTFINIKVNEGNARFIRTGNGQPAQVFGNGATFNHTISNCTFVQVFAKKEFANNIPNRADVYLNVDHNIFYDSWRINKYLQGNCTKKYSENYLWANEDSSGSVDESDKNYGTVADPGFNRSAFKELDFSQPNCGLNLKPSGAASAAGDPRWRQ